MQRASKYSKPQGQTEPTMLGKREERREEEKWSESINFTYVFLFLLEMSHKKVSLIG